MDTISSSVIVFSPSVMYPPKVPFVKLISIVEDVPPDIDSKYSKLPSKSSIVNF